MAGQSPRRDENRTQVGGQNPVEVGNGSLLNRRKKADSYIVDHNIQIAPFGKESLQASLQDFGIADIEWEKSGSRFQSGTVTCHAVTVAEGDTTAGMAERFDKNSADTVRSSRNENPASGETTHDLLRRSLLSDLQRNLTQSDISNLRHGTCFS